MRSLLALLLGAAVGSGVVPEENLDVFGLERSFNESCNALNDAATCEKGCDGDYEECLRECDPSDSECRNLCNRDYTTCYDRCPCHDKCSWGCPCGFFQCDPLCQDPADKPYNEECAEQCIRRGDIAVGECIGDALEEDCYEFGNRVSIECMEKCPCYDECPTCKYGMCSPFCPPSDFEKCEILWEYENNQCIKDCDDTRAQLLDDCKAGCNGESECIDECVLSANTWHSCCFKECPCHTNCQEGCPCSDTTWECGDPEMPSYCPEGGFQPDPECLTNPDNIAGVQACVSHCTDISYNCYRECAEGEEGVDCRYECKVQEAECKNQCPCYEQCPHGCPCSPWCLSEEQICETVWEYENQQCTGDCDTTRSEMFDMCKGGCAGDSACIDSCLETANDWQACCYKNCPCHTYCPNGCPCYGVEWECGEPEMDGYCPEGGFQPDRECIEENIEAVSKCINHCQEVSFNCVSGCQEGDDGIDCRKECRDQERECKQTCPCYEQCPEGCPCPGWCDDLSARPCNVVHAEEIACCEGKCDTILADCEAACSGDDEQVCKGECLYDHADCTSGCPCYQNCEYGCPCNNYNTANNTDCCGDIYPQPPENDNCRILWGDEMDACRTHCTTEAYQCITNCNGDETCEVTCRENNAVCVGRCPCYQECPNGCPCPIWDDMPNFCPVKLPDPLCLQTNQEEINSCISHCYDLNYNCVRYCQGEIDVDACHDECYENAVACPENCPCFGNCPNGCPCGYDEADCPNRPFIDYLVDTRDDDWYNFTWCEDHTPPDFTPDANCEQYWAEPIAQCMETCDNGYDNCKARCDNDPLCLDNCAEAKQCCINDCPCQKYCIAGCPCLNDNDWCPEYPINDDCLVNWDPQSDNCAYDCTLARVNCVQDCEEINGEYECYETCKDTQDSCLRDCICYENCPNGCDLPPFNTTCPSWDAYCPATVPVTTTEIPSTGEQSTTEETTLTTASTLPPSGEIGPPGPPIVGPEGDMILIVSDDKAMLHNWPKGGEEYFFELQGSYQDFNSKFDFNGYWVKDSCAVQFQGQSYIIGGAYNCASGNEDCEHINVQRSVVKLAEDGGCGFDIVWDGASNGQKLPFDMKEHSCSQFQKRNPTNGNLWQERVMICAPDEAADDANNDKVSIERYCWSTALMTTGDMKWEQEPQLQTQHLKSSLVYHKGRLNIIGGTGNFANSDGQESINSVEWLNQNNVQGEADNGAITYGEWRFAAHFYPISIEQTSTVATDDYLYVFGGLSEPEDGGGENDAALYNRRECYKNLDPSQGYEWVLHGNLLRPRAAHQTAVLDGQLHHIAGYAKDYSEEPAVLNGRRVEKWEDLDDSSTKIESADRLFRYTSPEVFIVWNSYYSKCPKKNF